MNIPLIKICGITRQEDAKLTAKFGAWAIGFIFVKNSSRYIEPEEATKIIQNLPESLEKVGVFADVSLQEIKDITYTTKITKIQLHGDESREFCAEISNITNLPVIKAFRIKDFSDLDKIAEYKNYIFAALLDTFSSNQLGGTGKVFDWNIAKQAKLLDIPIILAGGLNPENIVQAYSEVQPYALDVSSGVEKSPGIKDHDKIEKLFSSFPFPFLT